MVLLPMYRYLRDDSPRAGPGRGFEYAASWSLHAEEALSFFVPEFSGTDVQSETYWGKNPFKHNSEYGGALVFVLGIAAVVGLKGDRRRWGLAAMAPLRSCYALGAGTPVFRVLYTVFPGSRTSEPRAWHVPCDCRASRSWRPFCSSARSPGTDHRARRVMSGGLASGAMACAAAGGRVACGWHRTLRNLAAALRKPPRRLVGLEPLRPMSPRLIAVVRSSWPSICGAAWGAVFLLAARHAQRRSTWP